MTTRDRIIANVKSWGLEPTIVGATVQWTNSRETVIVWFDDNGEITKTESKKA